MRGGPQVRFSKISENGWYVDGRRNNVAMSTAPCHCLYYGHQRLPHCHYPTIHNTKSLLLWKLLILQVPWKGFCVAHLWASVLGNEESGALWPSSWLWQTVNSSCLETGEMETAAPHQREAGKPLEARAASRKGELVIEQGRQSQRQKWSCPTTRGRARVTVLDSYDHPWNGGECLILP